MILKIHVYTPFIIFNLIVIKKRPVSKKFAKIKRARCPGIKIPKLVPMPDVPA